MRTRLSLCCSSKLHIWYVINIEISKTRSNCHLGWTNCLMFPLPCVCERSMKALARLPICAGSSEPSPLVFEKIIKILQTYLNCHLVRDLQCLRKKSIFWRYFLALWQKITLWPRNKWSYVSSNNRVHLIQSKPQVSFSAWIPSIAYYKTGSSLKHWSVRKYIHILSKHFYIHENTFFLKMLIWLAASVHSDQIFFS